MAKEHKQKAEHHKPVHHEKPAKPHYFPKGIFLFGLSLITLAAIDYFKVFTFPNLVFDIILVITGLWIIKVVMTKSSYNRRKHTIERYRKHYKL